jgi:hypothetical protein
MTQREKKFKEEIVKRVANVSKKGMFVMDSNYYNQMGTAYLTKSVEDMIYASYLMGVADEAEEQLNKTKIRTPRIPRPLRVKVKDNSLHPLAGKIVKLFKYMGEGIDCDFVPAYDRRVIKTYECGLSVVSEHYIIKSTEFEGEPK